MLAHKLDRAGKGIKVEKITNRMEMMRAHRAVKAFINIDARTSPRCHMVRPGVGRWSIKLEITASDAT